MINHRYFTLLFQQDYWLLPAVVIVACVFPWSWLPPLARGPSQMLGGRRGSVRMTWWLAVAALGCCWLAAQCKGWPAPSGTDEFSYLLGADTLAQGRLTNPRPPLWEHFETPQVLLSPTYVSKYPPAQAAFLALGQVVAGEPIMGAWLSYALLCAALWWLLRGELSNRVALLGTLLIGGRLLLHAYWTHGYWGGCVPALGGVLVVGAALRLSRGPRWLDGVWLGLGLALLANSRPLEGLLAAAPWCLLCLWRWGQRLCVTAHPARDSGMSWSRLAAALAPTLTILLTAGAGMATYNRAVTGDWRRMPYQEHLSQYVSTPLFVWQAEAPPKTYRHPRLERIHRGWERDQWRQQQTLAGWSAMSWRRLQSNCFFYSGWLLAWPLALGWLRGVGAESWTARAAMAIGLLMMVAVSWNFPHYLAPMLGAYAYLLGQGVRILQVRPLLGWERRLGLSRRFGRRVTTGLVLATLTLLCLYLYPVPAAVLARRPAYQRQTLIRELTATGEQHLVVVRCDPVRHEFEEDWVYNGADFATTPVLWAREMNPEADRRLLAHYRERKAWLLDFDVPGRKLQPHPLASQQEKPPSAAESARHPAPLLEQ